MQRIVPALILVGAVTDVGVVRRLEQPGVRDYR
jgi:hypothetical protein